LDFEEEFLLYQSDYCTLYVGGSKQNSYQPTLCDTQKSEDFMSTVAED
jgi:hypothetical protein